MRGREGNDRPWWGGERSAECDELVVIEERADERGEGGDGGWVEVGGRGAGAGFEEIGGVGGV